MPKNAVVQLDQISKAAALLRDAQKALYLSIAPFVSHTYLLTHWKPYEIFNSTTWFPPGK